VDLFAGIKAVKMLGLVEIPEHGGAVLATRSTEGTVRGDSDSVDISSVPGMVGLNAARRELPDLNQFIPSSRDNHGVLRVWRETDAGNPVGMSLVSDGELAVTKGVPELNGTVPRPRHDLTVIGGKRNTQDIVVVANKAAGGLTGGEFPQTEGPVPRGRESIRAVGRDDTIRNNMRVTLEASLRNTVANIVASKIPDDQSLIARSGQEHVGVLEGSSKGRDPVAMPFKGSTQNHLFSHFG